MKLCPISKTNVKKVTKLDTNDLWSDSCGARRLKLAARPKWTVLKKIPGQLESSFLFYCHEVRKITYKRTGLAACNNSVILAGAAVSGCLFSCSWCRTLRFK